MKKLFVKQVAFDVSINNVKFLIQKDLGQTPKIKSSLLKMITLKNFFQIV